MIWLYGQRKLSAMDCGAVRGQTAPFPPRAARLVGGV